MFQFDDIRVDLTLSKKPGPVRAFARVELYGANGSISQAGFRVVQQNGKEPWIAMPSCRGAKDYIRIANLRGQVRESVIAAILRAYERAAKH